MNGKMLFFSDLGNGSKSAGRNAGVLISGLVLVFFLCSAPVSAHFGVLLPGDDIVEVQDSHHLSLVLQFMHPFEQSFMDLARPEKFGFVLHGKFTDMEHFLQATETEQHRTWKGEVDLQRPGDYLFYFVPKPYWEPAENCYIQHFTKVIVNAFGLEEGWSEPAGLEAEIVPLTRPYALWTGDTFRGLVLFHGKPVPGTDVEIEYYNAPMKDGSRVTAPAPPYVTQVVRTDDNGIFSAAMPMDGWWGFAALITDPKAMKHNGTSVDVEKGAVIWVRTRDMKRIK